MSAFIEGSGLRRLVGEAQRGDPRAADRLVREHDRWLRSVVYGISGRADLVDDLTQQIWLQVWERLQSLREPERLRPWLYAIARHATIDAGLARKRRPDTGGGPDLPDPRSAEPDAAAALTGGETHRTLLRAIESLPALYREPFVLRHLEDWSYAEIAEALGLPVDTVETRLARARRLLRETLQGKLHP